MNWGLIVCPLSTCQLWGNFDSLLDFQDYITFCHIRSRKQVLVDCVNIKYTFFYKVWRYFQTSDDQLTRVMVEAKQAFKFLKNIKAALLKSPLGWGSPKQSTLVHQKQWMNRIWHLTYSTTGKERSLHERANKHLENK